MTETGAIRIHQTGGPNVLTWETQTVGLPGLGQVRLRHTAIGLNFIDTYHRQGLYPIPTPFIPGMEAAGIIEAVGDGVSDFKPGDRVAYCSAPIGAYCQVRLYPAEKLVRLPDTVADDTAAAMLLQGLTAQYLLRQTYRVQPGDWVLIHAAAGGVGLIACQWAAALGATVIGTVSTPEKAELARANGCHHPILYRQDDFVAKVRDLTDGKGVAVVYDGVGKDTFMGSLDCLRPRGMMALYGQASGPVAAFDPQILNQKGSLFLTRPSLGAYTATRAELVQAADELFSIVASGKVRIRIGATFPLAQAAAAHQALESRQTTGSVVLIP